MNQSKIASSGDPMLPLRWTCKSTYNLSDELKNQGYPVSPTSVRALLKNLGYSLQSNQKRFEGSQHPDRNSQFEYIATATEEFQDRGCPVISVDAKKKELVGNFANKGREWQKAKHPLEVEAYDFIDKELGKVTPYGAYDITHNLGWVNVGTDNDTAQFAVRSIQRWWEKLGERMYPDAEEIQKEIIPIPYTDEDGNTKILDRDTNIKPETTAEKINSLPRPFKENGFIHAAASSGLCDGASLSLLVCEEFVKEYGLKPRARIVANANWGVHPKEMLDGVIPGTRLALKRAGLTIDRIDRFEINEAFASVPLAWMKALEVPEEKVNVNGGAFARDHFKYSCQ